MFGSLFAALLAAQAAAAPDGSSTDFWAVCRELTGGSNPYFGRAQVGELRLALQGAARVEERVRLRSRLATELLRLGEAREAVRVQEDAVRLAGEHPLETRVQLQVLAELGLAYLRLGEVTNCLGHHGPAMCLFPIGPRGRHAEPEAAAEALRAFRAVLEGAPGYALVGWLANVAAMTAGEWPEGVPPAQRVPPARLGSAQPFPAFRDVAWKVGLRIQDNAGGLVVDDFDGDEVLDVVSSSFDPCTPLRFFRGDGKGGFVDAAAASGLASQLGGLNLIHGDYDGDGDPDLLVLRGAWLGREGRIRNSLLRNDGRGRFEDVTEAAGLGRPAYPTQTAAWADYDGDGDLDLYVGNEALADNLASPSRLENVHAPFPSQLFRNEGGGRFRDVAVELGVSNGRFAKGVAWGDYDGDGDPDLYVSNIGPNRLYRNDRASRFVDVAPELGVTEPEGRSFATWWFDYDQDGDLDLFVADYGSNAEEVAAYLLGGEVGTGHPRLYRNDGGRFSDVSRAAGFTAPTLPMGANFGDVDGDGWLDVYLGTGLPSYEALVPNLMYRNDSGRRFVDVTAAGGFGHLQKGHGVAFADFDEDGDQDVFEQMGGAFPGDRYPSVLFENPGPARAWLALELVGRRANRSAFGAELRLELDGPSGPRRLYRTVGTGGSFGGSPLRQQIGLGDAERIVRLELRWPGSGTRQVFERLEPRRRYRIVEGEPEPSLRSAPREP